MLPLVWLIFTLRLLCVVPIGLLLTLLSLNPAIAVGGGYCCRSLRRTVWTGFSNQAVPATTLPVQLGAPALPIVEYHAGVAPVETFLYTLHYLLLGCCRCRPPVDAHVAILGADGDRLVPQWMHQQTVKWWARGAGIAPPFTLARGQGHFLADER
jgi:hypothetical protein